MNKKGVSKNQTLHQYFYIVTKIWLYVLEVFTKLYFKIGLEVGAPDHRLRAEGKVEGDDSGRKMQTNYIL